MKSKRIISDQVDQSDKRQRLQNDRGIISVTKITDLNQDCLEEIFFYTYGNDLLNLCEASGHLIRAAYNIFRESYGKKEICFRSKDEEHYHDEEKTYILSYEYIHSFIQYFGDSIMKMCVSGKNNGSHSNIIRNILKYNFRSLKTLTLLHFDIKEEIPQGSGSLPNLQTLNLYMVSLNGNLQLDKHFAALEELNAYHFTDKNLLNGRFPLLERVTIDGFDVEDDDDDDEQSSLKTAQFLQLNPKIRRLHFVSIQDSDLLYAVYDYSPQIEEIHFYISDLSKLKHQKMITFTSVKKFKLEFCLTDDRDELFIEFKGLEHLEIETGYNDCWPPAIDNFIKKHTDLISLKLKSKGFCEKLRLMREEHFFSIFPKLIECQIKENVKMSNL